ncbi:ImuA family protein [Microvirga tunisiensis]|uniref:Damage-inducible mutagenesis protein n=1 Tax=Microvirga tunisiensis TaxID=2108360 RepID=A0A5N7MSP0_9HYPH|nr:damage-inducible mutagenesis protein [Microvirga tunisiensis]MPR12075.1 damage-inducible mutagenesis protein [Microvirga tunisiensis]MPR30021.1 damage-inducible mutagenesis protein [Microvirga tunisiensis]
MSTPLRPALSTVPSVTSATVAELRRQIERLEGSAHARAPLPFGIAAVDDHLPGGGLARGALHEVVEAGPAAEFAGSATLFTAGIAARFRGPVLWCLTRGDLFAPGLALAGLAPDRVIYAEAGRDRDVLPLVEEGLRERGLAAVVGEVTRLSLIASRRLQLAAEATGVTALLLRRWWTVAEKDLAALPSAAVTRWRIAPAPSEPVPAPGLGRAKWQVDLVRCRGGEPRSWILEACDAKGRLALAAALAGRPDPAAARRAIAR